MIAKIRYFLCDQQTRTDTHGLAIPLASENRLLPEGSDRGWELEEGATGTTELAYIKRTAQPLVPKILLALWARGKRVCL